MVFVDVGLLNVSSGAWLIWLQTTIHWHKPFLSCCYLRPASIVNQSWLCCPHRIYLNNKIFIWSRISCNLYYSYIIIRYLTYIPGFFSIQFRILANFYWICKYSLLFSHKNIKNFTSLKWLNNNWLRSVNDRYPFISYIHLKIFSENS